MSKSEISFKNIVFKVDNNNEKEEINEKPKYEEVNNNNLNNNNMDNEKLDIDEKIHENNIENNNNYSINETNPNFSISIECLNYYLSYYYEQEFSLDEKEEPKNAGFFARLFGNYPKIYPILPELKSERDFIIFLKRNTFSNEDDKFDKVYNKIMSFIENNIYDISIEESKIKKKKNPANLINKSNQLFTNQKLFEIMAT